MIKSYNDFENYVKIHFNNYPKDFLKWFWIIKCDWLTSIYDGSFSCYEQLQKYLQKAYGYWIGNPKYKTKTERN